MRFRLLNSLDPMQALHTELLVVAAVRSFPNQFANKTGRAAPTALGSHRDVVFPALPGWADF
jgi:hypothetical protein